MEVENHPFVEEYRFSSFPWAISHFHNHSEECVCMHVYNIHTVRQVSMRCWLVLDWDPISCRDCE